MTEWLLLGIALVMVAANGLFVAAEFSLITVDRTSVERVVDNDPRDARAAGVLAALRTLSTQLSSAQLGITVTSLIVGFIAEPSLAALLLEPLGRLGLGDAASGVAFTVAFVTATSFQMVMGELVPKNLAIARPYPVARRVSGPQRAFTAFARPLISLLHGSANRILQAMGITPVEELASARSAEELLSLVQRSQKQGTLDPGVAGLLIRSFRFGQLTAADVMVPRVRVRALRSDEPVSALVKLSRSTGHSRFPVLGAGVDDPVGLVHVKQAIAVPVSQRATTPLAEVMVPPVLVPESAELDQLLNLLRGRGLQMAIVADEYGGTAGVVTLEDLVEEIVGEILDEHDRANLHAHRRPDGTWSLSGLLRPDEVTDLAGLDIPESEDYDTLGGYLSSLLGHIPKVGDVVLAEDNHPHVRFTVHRMDGHRVDRVLAALAEDPGPDPGGRPEEPRGNDD